MSFDVIMVHMGKRIALRDDDVIGDIIELLDDELEECEDADEAAHVLVQWRDGAGFSTLDLSDFDFDNQSGVH